MSAAAVTGVLWDLDGTLVDSAADIAAAADRMVVAHGLPPLGEARVRPFIGDGARSLVERCVRAAGGDPSPAHLETFLHEYARHVLGRTVVHPPELAALLGRIDAPMAVVTNKPHALSVALLRALDLERWFPVVLGGDSLPTRKPDPAMVRVAMERLGVRRAVLVGDGTQDVAAGRAAGVPVIGVGWGIHAPVGADERVETVAELADALRRHGVPVG